MSLHHTLLINLSRMGFLRSQIRLVAVAGCTLLGVCGSVAQAGIYTGPFDQPSYDQLLIDVDAKLTALDAKIVEADTAGVNTDYAQVSRVTVDLFRNLFAPWDRLNPSEVQDAYDYQSNITEKDPVYIAAESALGFDNGHLGLVYDELADCIEVADAAIAELDAQIAGSITLQDPPDFATATLSLNGTHYELNGDRVIPSKFFWQPEDVGDEEIAQAFGRMGGAYYALQPAMLGATTANTSFRDNTFAARLTNQTATNRVPQEIFIGHVINDLSHWSRMPSPTGDPDAYPPFGTSSFGNKYRVFTHYDIDNPNVRSWITEMFSQVLSVGVSSSGSAERVHLLTNEPRFPIRQGNGDSRNNLSAYTFANFATWLENKYSTIGNLNSEYGTSYANFSTAAEANYVLDDGVAESHQGGPIWYDWSRFNMDRVNDWFTFLHNGVKAVDPASRNNIKIWGENSIHSQWQDIGIDYEAIVDLVDFPGSDSQLTSLRSEHDARPAQGWRSRYIMEWRAQSIMMDFVKSLAPNKPYIDLEWHGLSGSRWRDFHMEPEYIRASIWLAATHGLSAMNVWLWNREDDGSIRRTSEEFIGTSCSQPWQLDAYGRAMKEINAHGEAFTNQTPTERYYMVYFSQDSAIQDGTYADDMSDVYEALKLLNVPVGFTTPSRLASLNTTSQTVIVPRTEFISNADLSGLQSFVSGGGSLILVDDTQSFTKTEGGSARGGGAGFSPLATIDQDDVFTMAADLEAALVARKPSFPLTIEIEDGASNPAYGVLATQYFDNTTDKVTCALINLSQSQRTVQLNYPAYTNDFVDMITSETLTSTIVLEPQDVRLIRTENVVPTGLTVWFLQDPFASSDANLGLAYSDSIAGSADDLNGDTLTFTKLLGPNWLSLAANGALTGMPSAGDSGLNEFTIEVSDQHGGTDDATLQITVNAEPDLVQFDDFETGANNDLGNWSEGGDKTDVRNLNNTTYSYSGNYSVNIRNAGENGSFFLTNNLDLTAKTELRIEFTYITNGMEAGEDFWLQFSSNGGSTWQTVASYVSGTDFSNNSREFLTTGDGDPVVLNAGGSYAFTSTVKLRFICDGNADNDNVFIDDLMVTATSAAQPITGWQQYVTDGGLSGTPTDNFDSDSEDDLSEFAFGGDATNSSILSPTPEVSQDGSTASFVSLERNQADPGVVYDAFWTDDLQGGMWSNIWDEVLRSSANNPDYIQVERRLSIDGRDSLFFKAEATQP